MPPMKKRKVFHHKLAAFMPGLSEDALVELSRNVYLDDPNRSAEEFARREDLPDWYPALYQPALAVIPAVDLSEQRQFQVATADAPLRIPQRSLLNLRVHRLPVAHYFVNSWAERNKPGSDGKSKLAVAIRTWLKIRPFLLRWLDKAPLAEGVGFPVRKWKAFLKELFLDVKKEEVLDRLGLRVLFEGTEAAPMVQEMDDDEIENDKVSSRG